MFLTLAGKNITETKPDAVRTRLAVVAAQFNPTRRARFFRARPLFTFKGHKTMNEEQTPNYASTPAQIVEYYDSHLNLTLRELSGMTGRTIPALKKIILADEKQNSRGQQ